MARLKLVKVEFQRQKEEKEAGAKALADIKQAARDGKLDAETSTEWQKLVKEVREAGKTSDCFKAEQKRMEDESRQLEMELVQRKMSTNFGDRRSVLEWSELVIVRQWWCRRMFDLRWRV